MMKKIFSTLLFTIMIFIGFIIYLLESPHGLKIALSLTEKIIPGQLSYQTAEGDLSNELKITNFKYIIDNTQLSANTLHLTWQWWTFLTTFASPIDLSIQNFQLTELNQPYIQIKNVNVKGLFSLTGQGKLNAAINHVTYRMAPQRNITSNKITGIITGNYNDYQANFDFKTTGEQLPDINWQVSAQGTIEKISALNIKAALLNGNLNLTGKLAWLPALSWNVILKGQNLQPQQTWPDIPGKLQIALQSQGELNQKNQLSTDINIQDISGFLLNSPVLLNGKISYRNEKLIIDNLNFTSTNNSLRANGSIADTANLQINANFPSLEQFLPDFSGTIKFHAAITGSGSNPYINATLNANNIKGPQINLQTVNLAIQGNALSPKPLQIHFAAQQLKTGEYLIDVIKADLSRKNNAFHVMINSISKKLDITMSANAQQVNNTITGRINVLSLTNDNLSIISLKSPIQFQVSPEQISIVPNCIYTQAGKTCLQKFNIKKQEDKLNGNIQITANDFSYLHTLFPQIDNTKGNLSINMRLAGTTEKPVVSGKATLNASVNVPYLKTNFNPITLTVTGDSRGQLKYNGSITSKTPMKINGDTDLTKDFATNLKITGNNFQVINNSEANILVSPTLDINYQDKLLNIKGDINIPYAKITPIDFTSTVTLPSDVVIVSDKKEEKEPFNVLMDLSIKLGDEIFFSYAGLTAKLSGNLNLLDRPGGATTATGTLVVDKGQYKAYGQDLTIRDGKLIYTGGVVTNPGLNIEATRSIKVVSTGASSGGSDSSNTSSAYSSTNQLVGIRLQGTLNQPKLTLFSDPSGLSQSDILSYIVLGRATGKASAADAGSLVSALSLLNLGSHSENNIKNQLDHSLGLDVGLTSEQEYDADSASVVDNTSLSLGKAVSSKLSINYSIGIVVPINVLTVTYKLTEKLSLQSNSSSQGAGVDIFYHYSRD